MTALTLNDDRSASRFAAPLLVLIAAYLWLICNAEIGLSRGALLLGDLALASAPFAILLRRVEGRLSAAACITASGIGLATLGALSLLLATFQLPDRIVELAFLAATLGLLWPARKTDAAPATSGDDDDMTAPAGRNGGDIWWKAAAAIALALPPIYILFCGWLGGRGPIPGYVLTADLATDLANIRALLTSDQIPPTLLAFAGGTMGYHYGSLEAAVHLVRLSGIPPHVALLYIVMPVFWSAAASAAWLIARRLTSSNRALLGGAMILAASLFMSHDRWELKTRPVELIVAWLSGHALDQAPFIKISPFHVTISAGICVSWLCLLLLAYWQRGTARWLLAFATGLLALLDPFFFSATGLVVGIWALWQAYRDRSPRPVLVPAAAFLFAQLLQRLTSSTDFGYHIAPSFFGNDYVLRFTLNTLWHGVAVIAIVALGCLLPNAPRARRLGLGILAVSLALFAIANLTEMRLGSEEASNFNWYRWLFILPGLISIGAVVALNATLDQERRWPKYVLLVLLILAAPTQLLSYPLTGIQTLAAPTLRRDETFDTTKLAEALSQIPVAESLVVVSDLRYPSTNDPDNIPVISAIYGHRCYICVLWPSEKWAADMKQRYADVQLLRASQWSPQLQEIARQRQWTHLLVRKAGPHPDSIPLPLIFENEEYAVYRF